MQSTLIRRSKAWRDKHSAALLLKSDKWSLEMTGRSLSVQTVSWHSESHAAPGRRCEISMCMWNTADMSSLLLKLKCVLENRERDGWGGADRYCVAWMSSFPHSLWENLLGIQIFISHYRDASSKNFKLMLSCRYWEWDFYPKCTSATFGCVL